MCSNLTEEIRRIWLDEPEAPIKLLIAGSRGITNYLLVEDYVNKIVAKRKYIVSHVISGCAAGVDTLGEIYADRRSITKVMKPADWNRWGKSAGYKRNVEMGKEADVGIVFILDNSKGSTHMVNIMKELGKPVHVLYFKGDSFDLDRQEGFNLP